MLFYISIISYKHGNLEEPSLCLYRGSTVIVTLNCAYLLGCHNVQREWHRRERQNDDVNRVYPFHFSFSYFPLTGWEGGGRGGDNNGRCRSVISWNERKWRSSELKRILTNYSHASLGVANSWKQHVVILPFSFLKDQDVNVEAV